ncbi:hypothetical protein [Pseudomonas aeruginosa]|uniref:hypothetical protein n=1 Tax=Pseudomonas aeruginosa TaxID=287 RepID=UPI003D9C7FB4
MNAEELIGFVSERSSENKWCFIPSPDKEFTERPVVIDFDKFYLVSGAADKAVFVHDLKQLVICWINGLDGRRMSSPTTVLNKIRVIARFHQAVRTEGFERLCLLTQSNVERIALGKTFTSKNPQTINFICNVIRDLFLLREWLTDGLVRDPFPISAKKRLISGHHSGRRWCAPDEPSSLLLLEKALNVLEDLPSLVIPRLKIYASLVAEANAQGIESKKQVAGYVQARFPVSVDEVFRKPGDMPRDYRGYDLGRPVHLAVLVKRLQDACFIVLTYTSGFRVSEIRRMTSKSLVWRAHVNGQQYPYLIARRSKKRYSTYSRSSGREPDDNPWIISPGGVKAYEILVELSALIKARSEIDNIWSCYSGNGLWPLRSAVTKVCVPGGPVFNYRLNKFCEFVGLTAASGWHYKLHSHMGRKHFARYIVKRDRSGLAALALQYSHVSAVSVDVSYSMPDLEFRRLVEDELAVAMSAVVEELANTSIDSLYFPKKNNRSIARFSGSLVKERDSKRLLASGVVLIPCQWGYCDYERSQSACGGGELPNPEKRSPEVCSSCPNFLAGSSHAQWWKEYLEDSERVLRLSGVPVQTVEVMKARAEKAREILDAISGGL